ncbi:structural maintenance of chromosomes protein 5-like isoform X3 [Panicum virgatum]|uniref:structural maintenance of chromosomes protein 5-like isoform X3 n=1 Tax=Panicum virgatum TaxID=38727 RepID=UPI0019D66A50|nr:structural maintenance of chromosomes protein 5-like isoform X3 [Panicum virgatum]
MAAPRAAKRAKLDRGAAPPQRGEDDYVPGNIVEIELCNFMTYDRLVCRPGPRLNLVVGPNGSGKSSLVCAIALGLAGDPNILGRASSVGAFVQRGEVAGHVKISLRGDTPDDMICITRKIDTKNKSEWLLNGATVPKKEVIDVIKKFNIQVNNLTQFLPQDRVSEFAKLSPIQLLEETEKAVGDPDLPVQHQQLVERSKQLKALEVALKQMEQTLNNLKALNAQQEKDVERVRLRDNLLRKAELMKKKLPWLKFDMMRKEFREVIEEQEKIAKEKMEEAARIWEDSKGPIEELKKHRAIYTANIKKISKQVNENTTKRQKVMEDELQLNAELRAAFDDIDHLKKQEKSHQQRILKAKEDFAAAEKELKDLQPYEQPRDEMARLNEQIARVNVEIKNLKAERNGVESQLAQEEERMRKCSDRLKEMESKNSKLLQRLRNTGADNITEAYYWVQENKRNFRGEVYGPVLLEVNVQDKLHATYLENHVPNYIWKSFITQDASDRDYMVRQMKKYGIPVLNYAGERTRTRPLNITPEMKQLGIYSRLDQEFNAPDVVKEVLISQAMLDDSYIGTDETHRRADEVSKIGILDFWTPDNHYRWSKSRYGGHVSAFVDIVYPSRLFVSNLDVSDIENLQLQKEQHEKNIEGMNEAITKFRKKQRQLEDEEANIHKQKEEIINMMRFQKRRREEIQSRVDMRRRMLEDLFQEEDVESRTRKLVDQVAKLNDKRFQAMIKLKDLLTEAVALKWSHTEKHMASIELDVKIWEMEKGVKKFEKDANHAAREYEDRKRITQEHKRKLAMAKQHADSIAKLTEDLKKEFVEMPDTVEELEAAIQDTESEANSMLFLNQNVLQEYQNRQREIESISNKLNDDKDQYETCCSEIESVKVCTLHLVTETEIKFLTSFLDPYPLTHFVG